MEIWNKIKGYPNYEISSEGRVRKVVGRTTNYLKACDNGNGYLRLNLYKNGRGKKHYIHRLVASAFLSNRHGLPEVHHIDHDKSNNTLSNLKWVSASENSKQRTLYYRKKKVNP